MNWGVIIMVDMLQYIFQDFWHWIGFTILTSIPFYSIVIILDRIFYYKTVRKYYDMYGSITQKDCNKKDETEK